MGPIHLVRTQSGGEGGLYKCVRLHTWGRGEVEHMFVRTQVKNFYSHKYEKTTEL